MYSLALCWLYDGSIAVDYEAEQTDVHQCAVKNISICKYFCGVQYLDTVLCSYPERSCGDDEA